MCQSHSKNNERAYLNFKKEAASFLRICMLYPKGKGAITQTQIEGEYKKLLQQATENTELDFKKASNYLEGCLIQAELWELIE